jgi:hypothetical protein
MRTEHWLDDRATLPPAALARRMRELVSAAGDGGGSVAEELVRAAERALAGVLESGGQTRATALDLLAVDALVTCSVEKAADDPESLEDWTTEAMRRLAGVAAPLDA